MTRQVTRWACIAAAAMLVLGACGSSKKSASKSPTTVEVTTTVAATTTTAAGSKQTMTVTPNTGLHDGDTVHIVGKGFTPGASRGVIECADKGDQTGSGDCDLGGIKTGTTDPTGTVTIDFKVKKGPFGANNIVCGPAQKCLLSLSDLTASPKELATEDITFA
jgi:hypothetical protein